MTDEEELRSLNIPKRNLAPGDYTFYPNTPEEKQKLLSYIKQLHDGGFIPDYNCYNNEDGSIDCELRLDLQFPFSTRSAR